MTDTFDMGDVVRLKSGGPKMTVTGISNTPGIERVVCSWFTDKKHETGGFPPEALERYVEPPRPAIRSGRAPRRGGGWMGA